MAVPGMNIVADPFAISMQLSGRLREDNRLQQAIANQQAQSQQQAALSQQGFRQDLTRDVVRNAADIASVVGGNPVEAAIAQALGMQNAASPNFTRRADLSRLDQAGADVANTLAQAMQRMEGTGQMPQIDPNVLAHAGIEGLTPVTPQETQRTMMREAGRGGARTPSPAEVTMAIPGLGYDDTVTGPPTNPFIQALLAQAGVQVPQGNVEVGAPQIVTPSNPVPMPAPTQQPTGNPLQRGVDEFMNRRQQDGTAPDRGSELRGTLERNQYQPVGEPVVEQDGTIRQRVTVNGETWTAVLRPGSDDIDFE